MMAELNVWKRILYALIVLFIVLAHCIMIGHYTYARMSVIDEELYGVTLDDVEWNLTESEIILRV